MSTLYIYSFLSAVLSFMAFANNNMSTLIGAMILSPMMTPLTNIYSPEIKKKTTLLNAINQIIILAIFVFILGIIFGLIKNIFNLYEMESKYMKERTQPRLIHSEFISTLMVGFGVAYAIKENNKIARTGLTLGIVLIPMLVLAGLYFANYIYIKYNNLNNNAKYHLINCFKCISIYIINIGLSGLSFMFISKYI